MQIPLQITYNHVDKSEAIDDRIREHAAQLDQRNGHITSCRVLVEAPHRHKHKGTLYHVSVDITLPKGEIVANRDSRLNRSHEDVNVAIRDAFNAVRRRLEDYSRRRRHKVKQHSVAPHGCIKELFPKYDFGIIEGSDEHDVYFHRNSMIKADFNNLKTGDEVRFTERLGDSGPQASSVSVIGKHHLVA